VNNIDLDIVQQYGKLSVLYKIIVNLQNEATREQAKLEKLKEKQGRKNDKRPKSRKSVS
jgi:hypothetical protein